MREMSEIEVKAHSSERTREMRQLLVRAIMNVITLNEDATTMQSLYTNTNTMWMFYNKFWRSK